MSQPVHPYHHHIQRRPSLLYDSYEDNITVQGENRERYYNIKNGETTKPKLKKKNEEYEDIKNIKLLPIDTKKLTIDDLDMISLPTEFDKQMLDGFPMVTYFDFLNNNISNIDDLDDPLTIDYLNNDKSSSLIDINPFFRISLLRRKYIVNSLQDCESNIKYDLDNWLLYPKPLPKFWKFSKDKRFIKSLVRNDNSLNKTISNTSSMIDDDSQLNLANSSIDLTSKGFFLPMDYNEENQFFQPTSFGAVFEKHKKFGSVNYTGEYFDIDHFVEKDTYTRITNSTNPKIKKNIKIKNAVLQIPTFNEFKHDFNYFIKIIKSHQINSISERRLNYLLNKFELFQTLNVKSEIQQNKQVPYRDFYNTRKVDQNLLLSGCISQRQLNEFIWEKLQSEPDRVVFKNNYGDSLTLKEIFTFFSDDNMKSSEHDNNNESISLNLKIIDSYFLEWYRDHYLLNEHVIPLSAINISVLKKKYIPIKIRYFLIAHIFLEFDNYLKGEYFAELFIKNVIHVLEKNKYHLAQVSVDFAFYDNNDNDIDLNSEQTTNYLQRYSDPRNNWWQKFADWIQRWNLVSYNIRWNIQIHRAFSKLYKIGRIDNFEQFLNAIFKPLFDNEATEQIKKDPGLLYLLRNICTIDLLVEHSDDFLWKSFTDINTKPVDWKAQGDNPPVAYYMYYIYEKLANLNKLRFNNFDNTIELRSGASSLNNRTSQFSDDDDHYFTDHIEALVSNILLCNAGMLKAHPVWKAEPSIQYMYYLLQIPLVSSPLSSVSLKYAQPLHLEKSLYYNETDRIDTGKDPDASSLTYDPSKDELTLLQNDTYNATASRDITAVEQTSYEKNPFFKMFQIGMPVTLSCRSILDNSSYTGEPIMEEYSVAASIYLLNAADLCEFGRTSVLSSGYESWYKRHWIGVTNEPTDFSFQRLGNDDWYDIEEDTSIRHNVPQIRRKYRHDTFEKEWEFVKQMF